MATEGAHNELMRSLKFKIGEIQETLEEGEKEDIQLQFVYAHMTICVNQYGKSKWKGMRRQKKCWMRRKPLMKYKSGQNFKEATKTTERTEEETEGETRSDC